MRILVRGSRGIEVKEVQKLLAYHGYWILGNEFDGVYGPDTETCVREFQKAKNLGVDGKVGNQTYEELTSNLYTVGVDVGWDTNQQLNMLGEYCSIGGVNIIRAYLDDVEYVQTHGRVEPRWLFLHHTAGNSDPLATVKYWNVDKLGRVATQYCIGGMGLRGETKDDGKIIECFPDNYFAWHLGSVKNIDISIYSVGIELTNWGYLKKVGDKYYTYTGRELPRDQVHDLGYKFRGHQYWHNYTDQQLTALKGLIEHIRHVYPYIPLHKGLPEKLRSGMNPAQAFDYYLAASKGEIEGVLTHTNVRTDKFDCYPHPGLLEILMNLE